MALRATLDLELTSVRAYLLKTNIPMFLSYGASLYTKKAYRVTWLPPEIRLPDSRPLGLQFRSLLRRLLSLIHKLNQKIYLYLNDLTCNTGDSPSPLLFIIWGAQMNLAQMLPSLRGNGRPLSHQSLAFMLHVEYEVITLQRELLSNSYTPGPFRHWGLRS